MAVRGQLSGFAGWLLGDDEYHQMLTAAADARAEAAHWRAEHDRACQALDAANVRADKAEADQGEGWGRFHDAETTIAELRMVNEGLVGGQRSLRDERDTYREMAKRHGEGMVILHGRALKAERDLEALREAVSKAYALTVIAPAGAPSEPSAPRASLHVMYPPEPTPLR